MFRRGHHGKCENNDIVARAHPILQALQPDDLVECTMELTNGSTSTWDQTCVNQSNGESVCSYHFIARPVPPTHARLAFQFDLAGQLQGWTELIVETTTASSQQKWDFPVRSLRPSLVCEGPDAFPCRPTSTTWSSPPTRPCRRTSASCPSPAKTTFPRAARSARMASPAHSPVLPSSTRHCTLPSFPDKS